MTPPTVGQIRMPPLPNGISRIWHAILDLCEQLPADRWILVGGQMVMAHGLVAGRTAPRVSRDIDLLADMITAPDGLTRCVRAVTTLGFEGREPLAGNHLHRFVRPTDDLTIDLLAPDHTPPKRRLTTIPPRTTIQAPGGRQALTRAVLVDVTLDDRTASLPMPSVLGALVLKAAAYRADNRDRDRHADDAAFLTSLLTDPIATRNDFAGSDRKRLLALDRVLADPDYASWRQLGEAANDAYTTWRLLLSG